MELLRYGANAYPERRGNGSEQECGGWGPGGIRIWQTQGRTRYDRQRTWEEEEEEVDGIAHEHERKGRYDDE